MSTASITLDDARVQAALARVERQMTNARPLMQELGEILSETTKQRFVTSTAPDGSRWEPNAPSTILGYLSKFRGSFGRSGRITQRGIGRAAGKRPLIGETRRLSSEIFYQASANEVTIESGLKYSAIQQFGGQAGRGGSVTIPARPFLGLSSSDADAIESAAARFIAASLGA